MTAAQAARKVELPSGQNFNLLIFASPTPSLHYRFYRFGGPALAHDVHSDTFNRDGEIDDVNVESGAEGWFIFTISHGQFHTTYAVTGSNWDEAYEEFCDWQMDQLKLTEEDLKNDYLHTDIDYLPTIRGVPIDTDRVRGNKVILIRAELIQPTNESTNI